MTLNRLAGYLLLLSAAVYCCITAYPRSLFNGAHEYGNISFYSREPVSDPLSLFTKVQEAAGSGDFYDPHRTFEVYLTGGKVEYLFLAPFCWKHRACVHPISGKIFIAPSDLEANTVYGLESGSAPRFLSSVIMHELMLAQLRSKLGVMKYGIVQDWKKAGYAEHIAKETDVMSPSAICDETTGNDELTGYLEARLMVEMLAQIDEESYPGMMEKDHSYDVLRDRVMKKYCPGR